MRVLVGCETSGHARDALAALGHDAWSCDILPSQRGGNHIQGDVLNVLNNDWDMLIAFPPCTYLANSGLHWNNRGRGWGETERAVEFVRALMNAPIKRIAIENPVGILSTRIRKPDQIIQPYQFGHDASKATCLWLKNLPLLKPTSYYPPRMVGTKQRWSNQTDSGQNNLAPSKDRWALRSITYSGIAMAMSTQWGIDTMPFYQIPLFQEAI